MVAQWIAAIQRQDVIQHWLSLTRAYRTSAKAQALTLIHDSLGWFQYLSKHAARGLSHYQRSPENIPEGWKKTGRMWGHLGDWPRDEAMAFETYNEAFHRFRRMCRGWRKADARKPAKPRSDLIGQVIEERGRCRRIVTARRMLACHLRNLSTVRGCSEWMPEAVLVAMLTHLISQGLKVEQTD